MKVKAEVLNNFLDSINLSGEVSSSVSDCILRGTVDSLSTVAVIPSKFVVLGGVLKGDFSALGDIGIDNIALLKKVLSSCKGEVELTKTANKLKITSGKKLKVELALRGLQYITNEVEKDKYDVLVTTAGGNAFTLNKEQLGELQKWHDVFTSELTISGENNEVDFAIGKGENKLTITFEVPETLKKFSVKLSGLTVKVLKLIKTDNIAMSINDKATVISIVSKGDEQENTYLIAPIVK